MKSWRPLLVLLLVASPAGSVTPCMSHHRVGEYAELELLSVTANGTPLTDLGPYAGYQVAIQAELPPSRSGQAASYVRFSAKREHTDTFGREQREKLAEFYPAY